MRTEHYLFHVLEVTSESRVKFVDSKGISLSPWYLNTDRCKGVILMLFLLYVFGVGVKCILYCRVCCFLFTWIVSFSRLIDPGLRGRRPVPKQHYVNVSVLIKFSQKISVFTLIIVSSP